MEKAERAERARAAMACLDCAAQALKQARYELGEMAAKSLFPDARANDEIGKLQLRLRAIFEKNTGRKP